MDHWILVVSKLIAFPTWRHSSVIGALQLLVELIHVQTVMRRHSEGVHPRSLGAPEICGAVVLGVTRSMRDGGTHTCMAWALMDNCCYP